MIKWRTKTKAKNNVIRFLRSVSIFSELSDMQLWYISQRMDHRQCPKGSFILKEGTTGENCFFIVDGSVKITRSSREGRSIILAMLGIGDFFGEMSMFDGEMRSANVLAQEDTDILALSRKDFINILKEFPEISIQLLTEIAIRMRKSDQHITSLTLNSAEKRIKTQDNVDAETRNLMRLKSQWQNNELYQTINRTIKEPTHPAWGSATVCME